MLTIQYLEPSPQVRQLSVDSVVDRLCRAASRLQFSHLLIGWDLSPAVLEACRYEAERLGIRFLRWHPLLTGRTAARPSMLGHRVVGLSGRPIPAFKGLSDFTFLCPNDPAVQEAVSDELESLIRSDIYEGFFLDRIRFPSPAAEPFGRLGCFCEHCRAKAASHGVDLESARRAISSLAGDADGILGLALGLLGARSSGHEDTIGRSLHDLLEFRSRSVKDLVGSVAARLGRAGLEVGLDCFSPGLARMVGQDLAALSAEVDWIKVMTYAHALGPAGLPFELGSMCDFLRSATGWDEATILRRMGEAVGYSLPATRVLLEQGGLSPLALRREVDAGVTASGAPVLAGVELVDVAGVTRLSNAQIRADLEAVKTAHPAGLSLSWDLRHMPLDRLDLVRETYLGN